MPRRAAKRPTPKKRPQPKAFSAAIIVPALLVGAVIGFMPSVLTGSLSWSWFMPVPSEQGMEISSEPSILDSVTVPDPACCVEFSSFYGYTEEQCSYAGGTWEPSGVCGLSEIPDLQDPFAP